MNNFQAAITVSAYQSLIHMSSQALPDEACGIVTGSIVVHQSSQPIVTVTQAHPIRNAANNTRDRFTFDPEEWVNTIYNIQKNRQSLVGYFHSHPLTTPIPSQTDLQGIQSAAAGNTSYWVISLANPALPVIQPYWVQNGYFQPLMLAQISV